MIRERWQALVPREQRIVAVGAIAAVLLLGWAFV